MLVYMVSMLKKVQILWPEIVPDSVVLSRSGGQSELWSFWFLDVNAAIVLISAHLMYV